MKLFNMYIFNASGNNIFYKEWVTLKSVNSKENDAKLIQGMLVGLKTICSKLSPFENDIYSLSYKTNKYRLHYLEAPTRVKIILTSDPLSPPLLKDLEKVYKIHVECVVKSPGFDPNSVITSSIFAHQLEEWARNLIQL